MILYIFFAFIFSLQLHGWSFAYPHSKAIYLIARCVTLSLLVTVVYEV